MNSDLFSVFFFSSLNVKHRFFNYRVTQTYFLSATGPSFLSQYVPLTKLCHCFNIHSIISVLRT